MPQIANDSPPGPQTRRPGGYGSFEDSYDVDPMFAPSSEKKQAPNLLQRMDSIAPGPFNAGRRPSTRNGVPARNSPEDSMNEVFIMDRPGTATSNGSSGYGSLRAPRVQRKNDYGGFGPPQQRAQQDLESERFGMNRADTFPTPSQIMDAPARTPSAPGPRPDRLRRPSNDSAGRTPMTSERLRRPSRDPDTSRPPPPRASLMRPRTAGQVDSPAIPSINLATEFGVGNPYHTPSDSMSSSLSGYSQSAVSTQPSSRSSPSRSLRSRPDRKPSDTSKFDNLMSDLQSSMDELKSKDSRTPATTRPRFDNPFTMSSLSARPPPPSRGYDPRIDPAVQNPREGRSRSPLASPAEATFQDPAIQGSSDRDPSPRSRVGRSPPRFTPSPDRGKPRSRSRSRARDPFAQPPSRGDCKSCGLAITGKSISSADGRLTGRYHKACFVCTTCQEAFSSATFYVLGDKPYCELHYHELNGSLCGSCGGGIEGQYLEDEATKKHHPNCFRCGDCGIVLKDGYFEVNGKAFCEKDAWRRVQQPLLPGGGGPRKGSIGPGVGLGPAPSPSPFRGSSRGSSPGPAMGLPSGPVMGLPSRPGGGPRSGGFAGGFGLPSSTRLGPGAFGPRPRMEKRMTRLGIM